MLEKGYNGTDGENDKKPQEPIHEGLV